MKLFTQLLALLILAQYILCLDCPYGWEDHGNTDGKKWCKMPGSYGRGAGFAWQPKDLFDLDGARDRCKKENPDLGCEKWGLMIYPKCKEGFVNDACCMCNPKCPDDWEQKNQDGAAWCVKQE